MQAIPFIAAAVAGGGQAVAAYKKKQAHEKNAQYLREAKDRRMAAATREAAAEQDKKQLIQSRALAVGAASGAGTGHGFVKLLGDLNAEGEYRTMSVLWQGLNDAEGLIHKAEAEMQAAKDAITMGAIKAVTSALSAYSMAGGSFGGPSATTQSYADYQSIVSQPGGTDIVGYDALASGGAVV